MSSSEAAVVDSKEVPLWLRRARDLLWVLLLPCLAVTVAVLGHGLDLWAHPWETTRPEAFVLEGARRVAEGRTLYGHFGSLPFVVHVYNPLTYWVPGVPSAWLDLDLHGTLRLGRSVSYASSVLLAGLLAAIVWAGTKSRRGALLAFCLPFIFHGVALTDFYRLRPESPGQFLTMMGVAAVLARRRWSLPAAATAFFLAFAFKQSFIAAPTATFAYLIGSRRWREAVGFVAWMTAFLGLFFAAMAVSTRGDYFGDAFVALASNDVRPLLWFRQQSGVLWSRAWGLALAVPLAAYIVAPVRRYDFLWSYMGVAAAWSFWSAGKFGTSINYWAEFSCLLLLIVGLAAAMDTRRRFAQLAVLSTVAAFTCTRLVDLSPRGLLLHSLSLGGLDAYVEPFRAHQGPRLITNERIAVHVGEPEALDWMLLDHLVRKGVLDPEPLLQRIRGGHYSLIAVGPRVPTDLESRVLQEARLGPYVPIWESKPWNKMMVFERRAPP